MIDPHHLARVILRGKIKPATTPEERAANLAELLRTI